MFKILHLLIDSVAFSVSQSHIIRCKLFYSSNEYNRKSEVAEEVALWSGCRVMAISI